MKPTPQHSIERNDVNGNYEPINCRWATNIEQSNNTRANRVYSYNGVEKNIKQWSNYLNLNYSKLYMRLRSGKSFDEAISN
jgi:hypothetical protein